MTDGLKDAHRAAIVDVLAANERVERAVLFGSRATETFTHGSDVDIALFGEALTTEDLARLAAAVEELTVPQRVDLLLYDKIDNETLREHVRRDGIEWYNRRRDASGDRLHLKPKHRRILEALLRKHLHGVEVWAYGSRVSGKSHDGSDLDLVLRGPELAEIPSGRLGDFEESARESNIPFLVEARDWARLPERFHREIERDYVVLVGRQDHGSANEQLFASLPSEWEYTTLGAVCDRGGGDIQTGPFGSQLHASDYVPVGIPSIMPKNIEDNRIDTVGIARISPQDAERLSRYLVQEGDIVYSRRGDVERRALVRLGESGWLCGTGCLRVRFGENCVDSKYAFHYLGHPLVRGWIVRHAHGATMPNLNTSILSECPFVVPPRREQRAIARILGTLDDKIELNRRMNGTLEAMARTLFKSWFVDFDPVRARMEGRDTGLPQHLANLFPDRLVDSELGEIPEGWTVRRLGSLCHKPQYGYTASAKNEPVGPKFLRITDINKRPWIDWRNVPHCKANEGEYSKYRLLEGDVLIARMADPGHGVLIEQDQGAVFASYLIRFRTKKTHHWRLLQYWLKSNEYWRLVKGQSVGTTRVSLNAKVLSGFPIVVPPDSIANTFAQQIGAIRRRLVAGTTEMQELIDLRDTLLPKLISGEIRVPDAELMVQAVL